MNDNVLLELESVIAQRKQGGEEGSYTCYLFEKGVDKICKSLIMSGLHFYFGQLFDMN